MKYKFSPSLNLPDYMETALAPFYWSGIFSEKFRRSIMTAILATNREEACEDLIDSINVIELINLNWRAELTQALHRFGKEGFTKK